MELNGDIHKKMEEFRSCQAAFRVYEDLIEKFLSVWEERQKKIPHAGAGLSINYIEGDMVSVEWSWDYMNPGYSDYILVPVYVAFLSKEEQLEWISEYYVDLEKKQKEQERKSRQREISEAQCVLEQAKRDGLVD